MRRLWNRWLNALASPPTRTVRTVRLGLVCLEAREVPAVALPVGFIANSGVALNGHVYIGGAISSRPAYVEIDTATEATQLFLLETDARHHSWIEPNSWYSRPDYGYVTKTQIANNGEIEFIGYGAGVYSDTTLSPGGGRATVWHLSDKVPIPYIFPIDLALQRSFR